MAHLLSDEFIENAYQLVKWPDVQELMECDWFRQECFLYNAFDDQPYLSSAYFVPMERLMTTDPSYKNIQP